jgi:hypothetical protein
LRIFENRVLGGCLRTGYRENISQQGIWRIFENRVLGGYFRTGYGGYFRTAYLEDI